MKKATLKILEILLLVLCFLYPFLNTLGVFYDIFGNFSYWGYEQWPWYMKDKKTFILYSSLELTILWSMFFFTLYCKYKRKKYILILSLNFFFYLLCFILNLWTD